LIDTQQVTSGPERGTAAGKKEKKLKPQALTIGQKYEIANLELVEVGEEMKVMKADSESKVQALKAKIEETDIRMKEIKKDVFAFRRDIVVGAENAATGKTAAEKVIRYMEERVRDKDNQVNKLHDKNAHLRNELKRMKVQLSQKEEMGETLHTIDFDQLTIENQQFKEKIDERNRDLLKLKLTTGSTVTSLNNLKKQLNSLLTESDFLRAEITKQKQECTRLDRDIEKVTEDKALLERKNMTLKGQVRSAHVPQVTDYIQQKKDMYEMEQQIKSYERKVRVSEMATSKFRAKR